MEFLEVGGEVVDSLGVEELSDEEENRSAVDPTRIEIKERDAHLPDHVARLKLSQCLDVLRHGSLVVSLCVEVISVSTMDVGETVLADALRLGYAESEREVGFREEVGELG